MRHPRKTSLRGVNRIRAGRAISPRMAARYVSASWVHGLGTAQEHSHGNERRAAVSAEPVKETMCPRLERGRVGRERSRRWMESLQRQYIRLTMSYTHPVRQPSRGRSGLTTIGTPESSAGADFSQKREETPGGSGGGNLNAEKRGPAPSSVPSGKCCPTNALLLREGGNQGPVPLKFFVRHTRPRFSVDFMG